VGRRLVGWRGRRPGRGAAGGGAICRSGARAGGPKLREASRISIGSDFAEPAGEDAVREGERLPDHIVLGEAVEGFAGVDEEAPGRVDEEEAAVPALGVAPALQEHAPGAAVDFEEAEVDGVEDAGRERLGTEGVAGRAAGADADDALPAASGAPAALEGGFAGECGDEAEPPAEDVEGFVAADGAGSFFGERPVAYRDAERQRQGDDEQQVEGDEQRHGPHAVEVRPLIGG